ncbi:MAG: hypothetical protein ACHQF4_02075 [Sphingobacteriales bacterium]
MLKKNSLFVVAILFFALVGQYLLFPLPRASAACTLSDAQAGLCTVQMTGQTNSNGSVNDTNTLSADYVDVSFESELIYGDTVRDFDMQIDGTTSYGTTYMISASGNNPYSYRTDRIYRSVVGPGNHYVCFILTSQEGPGYQTCTTAYFFPTSSSVVYSNDPSSSWAITGPPTSSCNQAGACTGYGGTPFSFDPIAGFTSVQVYPNPIYDKTSNVSSQQIAYKTKTNFFANLINIAFAATCGGNTCSNIAPGNVVQFNIAYSPSYCTVHVTGSWNGTSGLATGAPFTINGPTTVNATDSAGSESYSVLSDPSSGASYSFSSSSTQATVNGYPSTSTTVSQNGTCMPGGDIYFTLSSQSNPIIDVH